MIPIQQVMAKADSYLLIELLGKGLLSSLWISSLYVCVPLFCIQFRWKMFYMRMDSQY